MYPMLAHLLRSPTSATDLKPHRPKRVRQDENVILLSLNRNKLKTCNRLDGMRPPMWPSCLRGVQISLANCDVSALWNDASSQRRTAHIASTLAYGLCAAFVSMDMAFAQIPGGLPGAVEPGRDRPPLSVPAPPNFDFRIETPSRSSVPRAVDEIRFHLDDIQVRGAVTLSPERFRPFYQALIGKDVTLTDILNVADAIEAEYRRNGYLLVRAFVPPQRVANGIFTINVVEGFIANVSVEGGGPETRERIRTFLQPALDSKPLRLETMAQALLLADLGQRHLARPVEDDAHGARVRMLDQQDHRPGEIRILHLRDGDEEARRKVVHTGQHTTRGRGPL